MKTVRISLLMVVGLLLIMPELSQAIPAFARKYGFNCNMCHTSFTKLNDFGQRYRDNGYQIPGQVGGERNVFETPPPLALRTSTGLQMAYAHPATTSSFFINGLDLLAAGALHKNISFLMIYTPRIDEPAADHTGSANGMNPSQLGALESANLVFSNVIEDIVNVRVGRFEPAYHPFSSKRSYYLLSSYEAYTFSTPDNAFVFDDNQIGVELTGHLRNGFGYGAGIVNGSGANPDNNKYKDVYLRLQQTVGRGNGQSAGQRIGLIGYYGWQPTEIGLTSDLTGAAEGGDNKRFYRVGGDLSLNYSTFNFMAMFMQGVDDKAFNPRDTARDYAYTGGFAELDWSGLLNNRLLASAMYNWVQPPSPYKDADQVQAFSLLIRYYLGDWTAVNIALHAEYTHREVGKTNPSQEDLVGLMIDFAF